MPITALERRWLNDLGVPRFQFMLEDWGWQIRWVKQHRTQPQIAQFIRGELTVITLAHIEADGIKYHTAGHPLRFFLREGQQERIALAFEDARTGEKHILVTETCIQVWDKVDDDEA